MTRTATDWEEMGRHSKFVALTACAGLTTAALAFAVKGVPSAQRTDRSAVFLTRLLAHTPNRRFYSALRPRSPISPLIFVILLEKCSEFIGRDEARYSPRIRGSKRGTTARRITPFRTACVNRIGDARPAAPRKKGSSAALSRNATCSRHGSTNRHGKGLT